MSGYLAVDPMYVLPVNRVFNPDIAVKYILLRAHDNVKRDTIVSDLMTWGKLLR